MNKSALIKIAGIVMITFLVITVVTFFLYPYLNEEKYEQIQNDRLLNQPAGDFEDSLGSESSELDDGTTGADENSLFQDSPAAQEGDFSGVIDSLQHVNDSLSLKLNEVQESLAELENAIRRNGVDPAQLLADSGDGEAAFVEASDEQTEEFAERVKSLLNLDEEELTPIANQMSQQELVRIYSNSGNIQREKLLRSLSPERAAKLMKEIML